MPRSTKHLDKTKFKKGHSGNPKGRPPLNPIQKALKNLTIDTYREVIELVLTGNVQALKDMVENPNTPAIQVGVATSFMKAIKSGDYAIIERIAERIVGKIPDVVNINSQSTSKVITIDKEVLKLAMDELEIEV